MYDLSNKLGMPKTQTAEGFRQLVCKGFLFTFTKTVSEITSGKAAYRLATQSPIWDAPKNAISLGPFAISRKFYEDGYLVLRETLSQEALTLYMSFKKIEYEKMGVVESEDYLNKGFRVSSDDDTLASLMELMRFWDIFNPLVYEHFVWIVPTEECRQLAEEISKKKYRRNDYRWWDVGINLSNNFEPASIDDFPNLYSYIPTELTQKWLKYLPGQIHEILVLLYAEVTKGGQTKPSISRDKIFEVIQKTKKSMV